jgi:hypothetical protein
MDPNLFSLDWARVAEVLATIVVLSFILERALSIVVTHRWYVKRYNRSAVGREFNQSRDSRLVDSARVSARRVGLASVVVPLSTCEVQHPPLVTRSLRVPTDDSVPVMAMGAAQLIARPKWFVHAAEVYASRMTEKDPVAQSIRDGIVRRAKRRRFQPWSGV